MKLKHLLIALTLASSATAFAGHDHGHDHESLHGGIVVEASDMDFELVATADILALHVRDHGKPTDVQGASAKLTLLNGAEKSEVTLSPAGDKLEAKGSFKVASGTKVAALVTLPGKKAVNVRFVVK